MSFVHLFDWSLQYVCIQFERNRLRRCRGRESGLKNEIERENEGEKAEYENFSRRSHSLCRVGRRDFFVFSLSLSLSFKTKQKNIYYKPDETRFYKIIGTEKESDCNGVTDAVSADL